MYRLHVASSLGEMNYRWYKDEGGQHQGINLTVTLEAARPDLEPINVLVTMRLLYDDGTLVRAARQAVRRVPHR